jgi:uncharacterized membrane protein
VFVWLYLTIADWFATGDVLRLDFERLPARDLATSIAWALYALLLLLLGLGVRRRSVSLRWVSLGVMMVTIAKVFPYDLGELQDLYRVASLLGLGGVADPRLPRVPALRTAPGAGAGSDIAVGSPRTCLSRSPSQR